MLLRCLHFQQRQSTDNTTAELTTRARAPQNNSVSGLFVNELESEKQDTEWLTNHQEDLLKGNYVTRRRKSRSTLEENSEGEKTEETSPKIRRKWKPRRKRKFKRSLLPESIENATSTINSIEDSSDVVKSRKCICPWKCPSKEEKR
ncbi:uncharacterized protein LOC124953844 [Vespa velutina]|uniref:uncharacterized protein LOC124953844 n=1 Tax=Vespa velutina TaxID=202808 RepID=UPI001FB556D9|nr:uncharacterized protein LOC124953844 [Vespa velutina]